MRRTSLGILAASLGLGLPVVTGPAVAPAHAATAVRRIDYHAWTGTELAGGALSGLRTTDTALRIGRPAGTTTYTDPTSGATRRYDYGRWVSPWVRPGFGLTQLVPSWEATTRRGTWIQVQVRGITSDGRRSSWDTIANWSSGDALVHRTSLGTQPDDTASVATDTWTADSGVTFRSWRLRVTLYRKAETRISPAVRTIGAMASRLPATSSVTPSTPGVARGVVLDVPTYSQMVHRGQYPQYGNGGEAWCSPTSTSMVLGYYGALPQPAEYGWVDPSYTDRFVDHAARMTYDYRYSGTGNWPFNTAFAASHTDHAFVTRLRSLREAERFVKVGIPVVASISFRSGALQGAPISSTAGHLVVIVGFTESGDVVVNDPAARTDAGVRRTYDRGQFENAWLPRSGGLAYIIRDDAHPLPARGRNTNW